MARISYIIGKQSVLSDQNAEQIDFSIILVFLQL
jgi:hypothetical protein